MNNGNMECDDTIYDLGDYHFMYDIVIAISSTERTNRTLSIVNLPLQCPTKYDRIVNLNREKL